MMKKENGVLRILVCTFLILLFSACATGPVVTVSEVDDASGNLKNLELKKEDIAKIQEIKKTLVTRGQDPGASSLSDILEKSASMTVSEYLAKYPEETSAIGDYRIGGYDVLSIIVYEEKDLSRDSVRVSAEGFITFPLIGQIKVADLTATEIEKLIARLLKEKEYLIEAHVSVMVVKYEGRRFSALGAISNPGHYPLQGRDRVLDGVSKAGGLASIRQSGGKEEPQAQEGMIIRTLGANGSGTGKKIVITFDLQGLLKGRDQNANILLAENDVLYIPSADFFYIIGEVKNPGSYAFTKKDITIVEAISMAGGFSHIAARNKTRIVRVEKGKEKIFVVKMDAITKSGKMTQAIPIRPNDLIVVPESFF